MKKKSALKNNGLWDVKKTKDGEVWLMKEDIWKRIVEIQVEGARKE